MMLTLQGFIKSCKNFTINDLPWWRILGNRKITTSGNISRLIFLKTFAPSVLKNLISTNRLEGFFPQLFIFNVIFKYPSGMHLQKSKKNDDYTLLSHLFAMHPFFTPWKHQRVINNFKWSYICYYIICVTVPLTTCVRYLFLRSTSLQLYVKQ